MATQLAASCRLSQRVLTGAQHRRYLRTRAPAETQQRGQHWDRQSCCTCRAAGPGSNGTGGNRSGVDARDSGLATTSSLVRDSDLVFIAKFVAASFAGGAIIKYGSLAMDLPFQPNAAAALGLIFAPSVIISVYLLLFAEEQLEQ